MEYCNLYLRKISNVIFVILCIFLIFVNDYSIFGVPLYLLIFFLICTYRFIFQLPLLKKEVLCFCVLFVTFLPALLLELFNTNYYFWAYIYTFCLCFTLVKFSELVDSNLVFLVSAFILFFYFAEFIFDYKFSPFGRNVNYRIIIFCSFIVFAVFTSNICKVLFLCFVFFLILANNSRGGIAAMLPFVLFVFMNIPNTHRILISIIGSSFTYVYFMGGYGLYYRALFIDFDNASELGRLYFFNSIISSLWSENYMQLFFGRSSINSVIDTYPHNILFESLLYGGYYQLFFILIIFSSTFALLPKITKYKNNVKLLLISIAFFISSLLSGDLFLNGPCLVLFLILIFSTKKRFKLFQNV